MTVNEPETKENLRFSAHRTDLSRSQEKLFGNGTRKSDLHRSIDQNTNLMEGRILVLFLSLILPSLSQFKHIRIATYKYPLNNYLTKCKLIIIYDTVSRNQKVCKLYIQSDMFTVDQGL